MFRVACNKQPATFFTHKVGHNIRMYVICVLHTDNQRRGGLGRFFSTNIYTTSNSLQSTERPQRAQNTLYHFEYYPHFKSFCSRYSYHGLWDLAWRFLSLSWWCPRWVGDGCSSSPRFLCFSLFVLVRWETPFLTELLFINRLANIIRIGLRLRQREK